MSTFYSNLTPDQISEAKEAFSMFDRESDGGTIKWLGIKLIALHVTDSHQLLRSSVDFYTLSTPISTILTQKEVVKIEIVLTKDLKFLTTSRSKEVLKSYHQSFLENQDALGPALRFNFTKAGRFDFMHTLTGLEAHRPPLSEIPTDELSTVLRSLGYNCTAATLQQMIKDADPDETGKISEETFLRQVSRAEHESIQSSATPAQLEGLRDGTRFFLGGKSVGEIRRLNESGDDSVPADDLLYVLKAMGERLSDEEAAELAREVRQQQAKSRADAPQNSTSNRNVDFKDLLKALGVAPKVGATAKTAEA